MRFVSRNTSPARRRELKVFSNTASITRPRNWVSTNRSCGATIFLSRHSRRSCIPAPNRLAQPPFRTARMEPPSRIRLAFLGADGSFLEMFEATRANLRFELAGVCEVDSAMLSALDSTTGAKYVENWEALLDSTIFDAVFVGR